jgi:hypothetical protein
MIVKVLAWQICTGCANTREVLVTLDEARRLQALPIPEREKHDGCYPLPNATRSEWITNGARSVPVRQSGKQALSEELSELERTDPKVAAAAASYDEMVKRVTEGRSHEIPCIRPDCPWHTPIEELQ